VGGVSITKIASPRREVAVSRLFSAISLILYNSFPSRFANNLFGKAVFFEQSHWLVKDKDFAGRTWR
jgi:hypothetical protein